MLAAWKLTKTLLLGQRFFGLILKNLRRSIFAEPLSFKAMYNMTIMPAGKENVSILVFIFE